MQATATEHDTGLKNNPDDMPHRPRTSEPVAATSIDFSRFLRVIIIIFLFTKMVRRTAVEKEAFNENTCGKV